jgi:hypothetical protein
VSKDGSTLSSATASISDELDGPAAVSDVLLISVNMLAFTHKRKKNNQKHIAKTWRR